jgi:hypothetical protein
MAAPSLPRKSGCASRPSPRRMTQSGRHLYGAGRFVSGRLIGWSRRSRRTLRASGAGRPCGASITHRASRASGTGITLGTSSTLRTCGTSRAGIALGAGGAHRACVALGTGRAGRSSGARRARVTLGASDARRTGRARLSLAIAASSWAVVAPPNQPTTMPGLTAFRTSSTISKATAPITPGRNFPLNQLPSIFASSRV